MNNDQMHLAAIVNASNDGIISKTLEGTITSWNRSAEKIFGYSASEVMGKNIMLIIQPDHFHEELEFMKSIIAGRSIDHFETIRLKKNGTSVDVSLTISPLFDTNGKVIGAVNIVYDISERKKAEQTIKDSEEKYQSFFKNNTDGILLTVTDGRILSANAAACSIFKMSEEEIFNLGRFGLVDETDPRVAAAIEERQRTGKVKAEITLLRSNGEKFPGEVTSVVYKNAAGEQRTSMIVRDISERAHAQELLIKSEHFNKGILASLRSHIAVIDNTGRVISVNKAWEDFAKANKGESERVSIGSNYYEVCERSMAEGDELARKTLAGIKSVFNKEIQTFYLEYPCHSPSEKRWFAVYAVILGSDDSKVVISHQNITERIKAENKVISTSTELKKTLIDLNKILDSSLDVICTINTNGEFVNVNPASEKVWGYTPEELIGSKFMNLVFKDDVEITSKAAEKIVTNIKVPLFENRYVHKCGRVVPLLWSVNWDERLQLMFCIAKDVTETKKLEKAKEDERDQFFHMFLKAPSAIGMLKGPNHIFEMANPLYLQLTGKKGIVGKTVAEVLPEVVEQGFVDILDHVFLTGEPFSGKETLVKVDTNGKGQLTDFYMNFIYQAYKNGEGEIEGVFFFINDVTEQVLSKKKIEKSEKFFKGVIENSDDMITMMDPAGKTIYASPAVSKKFGYTNEECLSLNLADIIHPDDVKIMQDFVMKVMMSPGLPLTCPIIRDRKKDGSYIWVEGTFTNFIETEGVNAIVANFRDITERKQSETERAKMVSDIVQRNSDLEQFSYIISHNLRAPVANIIGLTDELKDDYHDGETKLMLTEALNSNVKRLESVISDLNTILQTKREITQRKEKVILSELVHGIELSINDLIRNERVQISTDFTAIDECNTLKSYIHSIFYNLISNSIKYRLPDVDPLIEIRTYTSEDKLFIIFKDNGSGIDLVKKGDQVFGLYKRFHLNIEGKGMGLYMVKTQVETLGGKISVSSEVGKGTEFTIELEQCD